MITPPPMIAAKITASSCALIGPVDVVQIEPERKLVQGEAACRTARR